MDSFRLANLFIVSFNSSSIASIDKFNNFRNILSNLSEVPHIVIVQETWFDNVNLGIYEIPGYAAIHNCREDGYGGVSMYIHANIQITDVLIRTIGHCQFVSICLLGYSTTDNVRIIGYYRPPSAKARDFQNYLEEFYLLGAVSNTFLFGDSNINTLISSSDAVSFENLLHSYNFNICNSDVTRPRSGTCIDHVITNSILEITISMIDVHCSDHLMINCLIKKNVPECKFLTVTKVFKNYEMIKEQICNEMANSERYDLNDINESYNLFLSDLKSIVDRNTTTNIVKYSICPWINQKVLNLIKVKRSL